MLKSKLARNIKDWEAINERIIKVELVLKGYDIVVIGVYAPSNDETIAIKDEHDELLRQILDNISSRKEIILLGDFNARVGSKVSDAIVGPYGENHVNNNGEKG